MKGGRISKILIVDDDYALRLLYQEELSDEGHSVLTTDDCKNLVDLIERFRPDLIVLDIMVCRFNGLDILQEIRDKYFEMLVILCSSCYTFRYDMKSLAADYYVTKSADLSKLKFMVKMALETRNNNLEYSVSEFHELHAVNT
jgi:DNA-binding response OmpR family regulator